MTDVSKTLRRSFLFLLMVGALVLSLRLLNWWGENLQETGPRRFLTLEAARREFAAAPLYLPKYYPDRYRWPPREIWIQTAPYRLALIHVEERSTRKVGLAIRQSPQSVATPPPLRLVPRNVRSERSVDLENRAALLTVGECDAQIPCSQVSWTEGSFRLTVVCLASEEEALRIAGSMITPD